MSGINWLINCINRMVHGINRLVNWINCIQWRSLIDIDGIHGIHMGVLLEVWEVSNLALVISKWIRVVCVNFLELLRFMICFTFLNCMIFMNPMFFYEMYELHVLCENYEDYET